MINKNSLIKFGLYIVGIIIIVYLVKPLFTKISKYQENTEMLRIIDSLKQESIMLKQQQISLDSQSVIFDEKIQELDGRVEEIELSKEKSKQTHHTKIQTSKQYTPNQVDSFFKKRYSY